MDSRKKIMFSCTWGRAASLKRKGCAVKGLETKLLHKLCTIGKEISRAKPTKKPPNQNSSTLLQSLAFVRREIFANEFI